MKQAATILLVFCAALAMGQKTKIDVPRLLKKGNALEWPRTNTAGTDVEWVSEATAKSTLNWWGESSGNLFRSTGTVAIGATSTGGEKVKIVSTDGAVPGAVIVVPTSNTSQNALELKRDDGFVFASFGAFTDNYFGLLRLNGPAGQGGGSGIEFTSSATSKSGSFQLDAAGNMVFRQQQGNMYYDFYNNVYWRRLSNGYSVDLSIANNGNLGVGIDWAEEKLHVVGNEKLVGQLKLYDSGGGYGLQAYASSTIGYLVAQGSRDLRLQGSAYTELATSTDKNFRAISDGSVRLYGSLTADPTTLAGGQMWRNSTTDRFRIQGSSASYSVAQVETDVRMPVVRDVVAAGTNIPAAAVQEAGFWRVAPQYDGWKVKEVSFYVRTAGSGTGTVDLQAKRTTTGGSTSNFGSSSLSAGGLQVSQSTSLTVNSGDLIRIEVVGNSMTTVPQGLGVVFTLSPF